MKERQLGQSSRRALVEAWRERYLHAGRKEKTRMVDELVALAGQTIATRVSGDPVTGNNRY